MQSICPESADRVNEPTVRVLQCYFQEFGEIGDVRVFTGFDEDFFVRSTVDVDNSRGLPASLRASQGLVATGQESTFNFAAVVVTTLCARAVGTLGRIEGKI